MAGFACLLPMIAPQTRYFDTIPEIWGHEQRICAIQECPFISIAHITKGWDIAVVAPVIQLAVAPHRTTPVQVYCVS